MSPPLYSERDGNQITKVNKNANYTDHKQLAMNQVDLSNLKQQENRAIH